MRRPIPVLTSTALITALVATAVVAGTAGAASAHDDARDNSPDNRNRAANVIYLLGDGMGRTHVTAARERYYGTDGKLAMETLPSQGFISTYAVEKLSGQPGSKTFHPNAVTDSASAATAWSSGVKTYNAALGVDATGTVKPTIMELAKKSGLRTGNVSTRSRITST